MGDILSYIPLMQRTISVAWSDSMMTITMLMLCGTSVRVHVSGETLLRWTVDANRDTIILYTYGSDER